MLYVYPPSPVRVVWRPSGWPP